MSKSDPDNNSKILLTTPPNKLRSIILRAITDSSPGVYASPDRPGVTNLLQILAALENKTITQMEIEVHNMSMREFKERIAESMINALSGIQERYEEVRGNTAWLEKVRKDGNERARDIASRRIMEIKKVVGLI